MNEFGLKDGSNCPEMWAGGSWQQWPLQPSMFQNIPHEQIDWAALAQQWIQMRETSGGPSNDQPPPQMMGGNVQVPPRSAESNKQMKMESAIEHHDEGSNSEDTSAFRQGGDWNYWNNSNWNVNNQAPSLPPPNWNASNEAKESLSSYEFGQAHGNQGFAAQSYDYNHGSDQYGYNQVYAEQNEFNQFWPAGQPGAMFQRKEHRAQIAEREGILPPASEDEELMALPPSLDAAKRKQLPAWIREGLEKMEREKQKRLEKERLLKEREEQIRSMKEAEERAMKQFMEDKAGESLIPRKSKFDSDSEEEEENLVERSPSPTKRRYNSSEDERDGEEEDEENKSDEEKLADLMMRVRQLLTEILLEVTNEQVIVIAKEVVNRAKAKAPAMQLASSSALASITRGLGLGEYGTDDSEESGGDDDDDDDDAEDSDSDLRASIDRRKKEFLEKEKEIVAGLKNEESDLEADGERKENAVAFLQPSPEREKYHFEKKYNEIPGLDVSCLPDENSTAKKNSPEQPASAVKDSSSRKSVNSSSESDSEMDSRTSSSSRGRDSGWKSAQNEKSRGRLLSSSKDNRDRTRVEHGRRSRSRSRDGRNRRSRNLSRDRRDRRSAYVGRNSRKDRSQSRRGDRGRRGSRSYSRSRSRSPRKHSTRRGRENWRRESRSPSGEGSGKKSSRKPTT